MNKKLILLFIMAVIAVVGAFLLSGIFKNSYANSFIEKTTDEELKEIISNVDFLLLGDKRNFENVNELTIEGVFNLYASTKEVQDKMDKLSENSTYVEIKLSDVKSFVKKYFGDYDFDVQKFINSELMGKRIKYDKEREIIFLSYINGGVSWPGAMPYDLTIDSKKADGDNVIIEATCHAYDYDFSRYIKINLTLKATKDGFNYLSYNSHVIS